MRDQMAPPPPRERTEGNRISHIEMSPNTTLRFSIAVRGCITSFIQNSIVVVPFMMRNQHQMVKQVITHAIEALSGTSIQYHSETSPSASSNYPDTDMCRLIKET